MKKTQMAAGELYGYATGTSEYRTPVPLIVLDVDQLWTWNRSGPNSERQYRTSVESRPRSGPSDFIRYIGDDGYLALEGNAFGDDDQAEAIAKLRDLWDWFEATGRDADAVHELARKVKNVRVVSLQIVNNRWIEDTWEVAKRAQSERQEARDAHWLAKRAEQHQQTQLIGAMAQAMSTRGIEDVLLVNQHDGRVTINMRSLAELLGVETEG